MSVWDNYDSLHSKTRRDTRLDREKRLLLNKLPNSLSYHHVLIDGVERNVAITNTDNLDTKHIFSLPGEDIRHGSYVEWMDNHWLVTERDANIEIYTKAKMLQCNYLLKWVDEDKQIHEQWCIVEDGTKLKRKILRNSLAYRKQYAKRIPLIAGNPLELHSLQRGFETQAIATAKKNADWAISSQAPNRRRFNDYPGRGSRSKRSEMGDPKPHYAAW